MGNGDNVWNPLAAALCASVAIALLLTSGLTCSFVAVNARSGKMLAVTADSMERAQSSTTMGILCGSDFYDLESDPMWNLSRVFFFLALSIGIIITLLAWLISTVTMPTKAAWKIISAGSALSAVLQVPVYLMFESSPCKDHFQQQKCTPSTGSYLMIVSVVFWIAVTVITQFLDPPVWANNLEQWRILKYDTLSDHMSISLRSLSVDTESLVAPLRRWTGRRGWTDTPLLSPRKRAMMSDIEEGQGSTSEEVDTGSGYSRGRGSNDENSAGVGDVRLEPSFLFAAQTQRMPEPVKWDFPARTARYDEMEDDENEESLQSLSPSASFDGDDEKVSLGSLEPTIVPVTGDDSLLDGTYVALSEEESSEGSDSPDPVLAPMNEKSPAKVLLETISKRTKKLASREKGFIGYAQLDDDGEDDRIDDLSNPPPVHVVAFDGSESDRASHHVSTDDELKLLENWKELYDIQMQYQDPYSFDDPEPELPSSSDDSSEEGDDTTTESSALSISREEEDEGLLVFSTMTEDTPSRAVSQVLKKKRKKRRKARPGYRATGSIASSPSLLELTIEEETEADLEDASLGDEQQESGKFDPYTSPYDFEIKRARSAPSLASYSDNSTSRKVSEDVTMSGMNDFHRVENWRTFTPLEKDRNEDPEVMNATLISTSPSKSIAKASLFMEQRSRRGGMHAPTVISSESQGDDGLTLTQEQRGRRQLVDDIRKARIQRMQEQAVQSSSPYMAVRRVHDTVLVDEQSTASHLSADSANVSLDAMDLHLVEVVRPAGFEYGPDEASL